METTNLTVPDAPANNGSVDSLGENLPVQSEKGAQTADCLDDSTITVVVDGAKHDEEQEGDVVAPILLEKSEEDCATKEEEGREEEKDDDEKSTTSNSSNEGAVERRYLRKTSTNTVTTTTVSSANSNALKRAGVRQMRSSYSKNSHNYQPSFLYQLVPTSANGVPFMSHQLLMPAFSYFPSQERETEQVVKSSTNLYIRGLSEDYTDEDLVDMCKQYGPIMSTKSILDKKTLRCKGYGFVDFQKPEDAQTALVALVGNGVTAEFANLQEQDPTNLYISNLPKNYSEKELEQLLVPYGAIVSTRILREPTNGCSKGVGFVRLDNQDNCAKAIEALNNKTLPGSDYILNVKFADSGNYKRKSSSSQGYYWKNGAVYNPDMFGGGTSFQYPVQGDNYQSQYEAALQNVIHLTQNSHSTGRNMIQASNSNGNHHPSTGGPQTQYIPVVPQIPPSASYHHHPGQGVPTSTNQWNSYYFTPTGNSPQSSNSLGGGGGEIIRSSRGPLVSSAPSTSSTAGGVGGYTVTTRPPYHYPGASATGPLAPAPNAISPVHHTAHYTQHPPGWTITNHYVSQHPSL